ncbi:tetratricopeptide repeat protein 33-like [Amphiura filiformis]|uniref:tetratricopeptide repeat protein 33-like n=1 Tax=Amphiura filiformis TaxID=82378 RepID=UPI003B222C5A
MTSFGWKRKIGDNVSKNATNKFQEVTGTQETEEEDEVEDGDALKWLEVAKKRKLLLLEDARAKSLRLKDEGTVLAEAERYWEAIKKWDEALQLTPQDDTLLEMKAQVLMILHEVFPAVQTAEKAVEANPQWWVTYQTLARAQMGLGEIKMAIRNFCKAIHIKPDESDLWEDDLKWAVSLRQSEKQKNARTLCKTQETESITGSSVSSSISPSLSSNSCSKDREESRDAVE